MKYKAKINLHIGDMTYVPGQVYDESELVSGLDMRDFTALEISVPSERGTNEVQGTAASQAIDEVAPAEAPVMPAPSKEVDEKDSDEEPVNEEIF